jgi:hypothetical protein
VKHAIGDDTDFDKSGMTSMTPTYNPWNKVLSTELDTRRKRKVGVSRTIHIGKRECMRNTSILFGRWINSHIESGTVTDKDMNRLIIDFMEL